MDKRKQILRKLESSMSEEENTKLVELAMAGLIISGNNTILMDSKDIEKLNKYKAKLENKYLTDEEIKILNDGK